jgi:hypothetical protein
MGIHHPGTNRHRQGNPQTIAESGTEKWRRSGAEVAQTAMESPDGIGKGFAEPPADS